MFRTIVILFLFGTLLGNAFNSFHAFSGTIPVTAVHINPLLDWSSYLLFGAASVSIGLLTLLFDKTLHKSLPVVTWPNALGALGLLGVFYLSSACIFLGNALILLILIFGFILAVLLYDRSLSALLAALLIAIVGTAAEIYFVHSGMYYYARPQIMGVTYWLPFLYGISSVATGQLARALASDSKKQKP
jgi:hypothetical protein